MKGNIYRTISSEMQQSPDTRRALFRSVERDLDGRALVSFFTSFNHPVQIEDADCDALEVVLQKTDLSKGLVLMISSPGGNGLAAERIVNTCRSYSGTKDYWALVPGKAKSAATIVAMGASKIMMAGSSELGPVDPQIFPVEDGRRKSFSLHNLVNGYDKLFNGAIATTGRLEPFLQQLAKYDDREINTYRGLIKLAEDIAVKVLGSEMMKGMTPDQIKQKIQVFLNPDAGTMTHGRPIFATEAEGCGIAIDKLDVKSAFWKRVHELYVRTNVFVSTNSACKAIESRNEAFHAPAPQNR